VIDPDIKSATNPRIKAAARLRERGERDRTGLTIVDGGREILRALGAAVPVEEAFVHEPYVRTRDAQEALDGLRERGAPIVTVSAEAFDKVAFGDRSDGIVAVIRPLSADLRDLHVPDDPLIVVLEGVEKPGNVGAVLRSADGAGANAVVVADPRTDLFNPNTIRASLGTVFTVPLAGGATPLVRSWLRAQSVRVVAARPDAESAPWEVDLRGPVAIALGSEAEGLGARWGDDDVAAVRIPMLGVADSLNVSVAAAVLLYEARRQRNL
jgi:TrmH family RNA methyltransferase